MTLTPTDDERSVSVASTPASLGAFTITPVLGTISNTIALTDTSGNTFVYNTGDTENELPANHANKSATIAFTFTISYDNTLTSADEVNAAWDAYWDGAGANGLRFTVADNSAEAYEALTESTTPKKSEVTKVSTASGLEEAVKLSKVDAAGAYNGASSITFDVSASTLKSYTFTKPSSTIVAPTPDALGTIYVALKGVDGLAQVATTYYSVHASVAIAPGA